MITKRNLLLLVVILIAVVSSDAQSVQYDIVPLPQSIEMQKGEPFVLNGDVQILAGEGLQQDAEFVQAYLKDITGFSLAISQKRTKKVTFIELSVSPKVAEPEGYVLTVRKNGVTIAGGSAAGVFYGIQTLRKSLFTDSIV